MRVGRIRQLNDTPAPTMPDVRAFAQANLQRHYGEGIEAGVRMTLDHIEGKEAGGVPYHGPLPDELRTYIARCRKALDVA